MSSASPPGGGPYACPCCRLLTLETRSEFETCDECGWEDDGQGDADADRIRGGPNKQSLTSAREQYANEHASLICAQFEQGGIGYLNYLATRRGLTAMSQGTVEQILWANQPEV